MALFMKICWNYVNKFMHKEIFRALLNRKKDTNKYSFGHVLVIGGSEGMVGAPFLSATAALRTGAGIVTIGSSAHVIQSLEKRVEEIMTLSLPENTNEWGEVLLTYCKNRKVSVLVFGPGRLADEETIAQLTFLINNTNIPLVLDGGALGAIGQNIHILHKHEQSIILTPHRGELEKLIGLKLPESIEDISSICQSFSNNHEVTLVLKGTQTLICSPPKSIYRNDSGNPGLATAGSGDVLSGVIAGLVSQHVSPSDAAIAGVYLHGLAGDIASKQKTEPGMIASDIVNYLPAAYANISKEL